MNSTTTAYLAVVMAGLFACGCGLLEERPPDAGTGLDPDDAPFYEVLKDRYGQDADRLVGTWEWQFSTVYQWGEEGLRTQTPETEEETIILRFNADGTLETYRSGQRQGSKSYRVKRRAYGNGTVSEYPMLFMGGSSAVFAVSRDTLLISTMYRDGPESIYARVD